MPEVINLLSQGNNFPKVLYQPGRNFFFMSFFSFQLCLTCPWQVTGMKPCRKTRLWTGINEQHNWQKFWVLGTFAWLLELGLGCMFFSVNIPNIYQIVALQSFQLSPRCWSPCCSSFPLRVSFNFSTFLQWKIFLSVVIALPVTLSWFVLPLQDKWTS